MAAPRAYVTLLGMDGMPPHSRAVRVILDVHYDQKQAQIELPVGEPLSDQEPGTEVYRRELKKVLEALEEVAASPQGILWPPRQQS